jgi:quercetin dioxygenase-like cupin family protein
MRILLLVVTLCAAHWAMASQSGAEVATTVSAAESPKLVARHAEIPDVVITSIEDKPMHGQLSLKPLLRGEHMTLLELHCPAGVKTPLHTHTYESLIYVVSGRIRTWIGDEVYVLGPGDVARDPPGVLHAMEALVESTIVEVKSPPPDLTTFVGTQQHP